VCPRVAFPFTLPSIEGILYIQRQNHCYARSRHALSAPSALLQIQFLCQKPQQDIPLLFVPVVLLGVVADVQAETFGVQVDLVVALLEDLGNGLGVVELTQVDV
jgi:hypothetical protein